jgi:RNA polymerase sigma factor (sigma-70 family)
MDRPNKDNSINLLTAHLFRENSGKMIAVLSRMIGLNQIALILDVVQDTFEAALMQWRFQGVPDNPSGWLMTVARNKALNALKKENRIQFSSSAGLYETDTDFEKQFDFLVSDNEIGDSQLKLLFTCCHQDFSVKNQIILTLHILCGFGVPEIANALLMKPESVKKVLTRCKASLRGLDNMLQAPVLSPSGERIETVHIILYLMFNEGYKTTRNKSGIKHELCYEAIRLAKLMLQDKNNVRGETYALLALMFFNLSRFPARRTEHGEWMTLEEQDKTLWDGRFTEEGFYFLRLATQSDSLSRYHLEAIISSLHCTSLTFRDTDWPKIVYLYRQLELIVPDSPIIKLNRIIAESYTQDPLDSITAIESLERTSDMSDNFLFAAVKGDMYRRAQEPRKARAAYSIALELASAPPDKEFLRRKIKQCQ